MNNKLIPIVITLVVGVILAGSLLIPIVNDATTAEKTYINEGISYATPDEDNHVIVVSTDGNTFTITTDGETCETPDMSLYGSATLVYCEDVSLRLYSTGAITGDGKNAAGVTSGYNLGTVAADNPITITVNGTTNVTSGSLTFADARAYISTEGDYVLSKNPLVNESSSVMIIGGVSVGGGLGAVNITGIGTVHDFTAKVVRGNGEITDIDVNTTVVDNNLVKVESIVLTDTYASQDYEFTYTYFLAPEKITYTPSSYVGAGGAALLGAIPIMVIVALLVVAVGAVARRDE